MFNTYAIIYSRPDGSTGCVEFLGKDEQEAKQSFYDCYRDDNYKVISCIKE